MKPRQRRPQRVTSPMTADAKQVVYERQARCEGPLTPTQERRIRKTENRALLVAAKVVA